MRDNNNLYFHYVEEDENLSFNYNETQLVSFFVLRHQLKHDKPIWLNQTEKYLDISYYQKYVDWAKNHENGRYTR